MMINQACLSLQQLLVRHIDRLIIYMRIIRNHKGMRLRQMYAKRSDDCLFLNYCVIIGIEK